MGTDYCIGTMSAVIYHNEERQRQTMFEHLRSATGSPVFLFLVSILALAVVIYAVMKICRPVSAVTGRLSRYHPSFTFLLLALQLVNLIRTLWRPHPPDEPRVYRDVFFAGCCIIIVLMTVMFVMSERRANSINRRRQIQKSNGSTPDH